MPVPLLDVNAVCYSCTISSCIYASSAHLSTRCNGSLMKLYYHNHAFLIQSMKQLQKVSFVCHILNVLHSDSSLLSGLKPNESLSIFGKLNLLSIGGVCL